MGDRAMRRVAKGGDPPRPRRAPAGGHLAAVCGLWLAAGVVSAVASDLPAQERRGGPDPGARIPERVADEDLVERLARYRAEAEASGAPIDWYNYGTALLGSGRWEAAREALRRAAPADDETLEAFARYNQALASAESGRGGSGRREEGRERLLEARSAFRAVLRRDPADADARWNLELVQRWLRQREGGGGGGSGAGQAPSSGAGSARPAGSDGGGGPVELGLDEAEALLEAAGRAESSVRDRMLGRARLRDPVVERNW